MSLDLDECLRSVVQLGGSDLHLKVYSPPSARVNGKLAPLPGTDELTPEDTEAAVRKLLSTDRSREEFASDGEADLSYELKGISRFRVNAFRQRGAVSVVCRAIPFQVRTIEDLGLPAAIRDLAEEPRGIILLTGTTGSGKSTTLAAMIDHINSKYHRHVITLEDPIEYLHRDKKSLINQREVGSDTISFAMAMRRVLRQDPDVILVGEMRDEETVRTALSAAETGHLVLSTLHTLDATETINRIIDFFPPHLQQQARVMLASTLRGAVSQRLVPTRDGAGRVAASEILVVTGRVQDLILNPNETGKITQVIAEGDYYGMQTFDQSLLKQVSAGAVDEETAMDFASSPHDFKLMLANAGKAASDMSNVPGEHAQDRGAGAHGVDRSAADGDEPQLPAEPQPALTPAAPVEPDEHEAGSADGSAAELAPAGAEAQPQGSVNGDQHEVDYGSPDHAYGRSLTPRRQPAAEAEPTPVSPDPEQPVAPVAPAGDSEYGADEYHYDEDDGDDGSGDDRSEDGPEGTPEEGLGDPAFSEIWDEGDEAATPPAAEPAPTPRSAEQEDDRLAEYRPRKPGS